jgi:hypothetical protein
LDSEHYTYAQTKTLDDLPDGRLADALDVLRWFRRYPHLIACVEYQSPAEQACADLCNAGFLLVSPSAAGLMAKLAPLDLAKGGK